MSHYVIGDIHGCFRTLQRLLTRIRFDADRDRLWLVGDLVNRGPNSLEVLRWARELDDRHVIVLGNHDLHLLARALSNIPAKASDTLDAVLDADDRDDLLAWLRRCPFTHQEGEYLLVHAGLLPNWGLEQIQDCSRAAGRFLTGERVGEFLSRYKSPRPPGPDQGLSPIEQACRAAQVFTKVRTCTAEGRCCFDFTGSPEQAPEGCIPWFSYPRQKMADLKVVFGHWSALGFHRSVNAICLDTGCVHRGVLTALCLENEAITQEPCVEL